MGRSAKISDAKCYRLVRAEPSGSRETGGDMKTIATILVLAAALGGCAQARINAASEEMEREKATCRAAPKTTHMNLARCINAAEEKAYRNSGISGGDLVSVRLATRMAIAEKQDKGHMTEAEAELEFARTNSGLVSTDQQRRNSAVTADAISSMAAPRSTTCTRIGNSVTCF